ncbi:HD domain-containing protein [Candidatus Peregrinibacteria bacterium]|nr:HD domain-containing protein [Candidatus Peregrinibacteria bacterium]
MNSSDNIIGNLASYAIQNSSSKRRINEEEDPNRSPFQVDCHRILFSNSFSRLANKTQVLRPEHGDHYKNRLLHTLYVAENSVDIAGRLKLNKELSRAIALAHDLGHTPYGHKGEEALNEIMEKYKSRFEHNEQSLWIVKKIENLNLSDEVLDGLDKHRTEYDNPRSQNDKMPSLEAQVVNVADEISYLYHDIDDGIRAGAFSFEELNNLKIWRDAIDAAKGTGHARSQIIKLMVADLVYNTTNILTSENIQTPDDVYNYSGSLVKFSDDMQNKVDELRNFLFEKFYNSKLVMEYNQKGMEIIQFLFAYYYNRPEAMSSEYSKRLTSEEKYIVVKDYIAGMTDRYALEQFIKYNK